MIEFPCRCGHHFSLPEDQAGGLVQCPRCSRLNDVPNLGEIANLDEDGAYKMEPTIARHETPQQRMAEVTRAFMRSRLDQEGQEIDLRPTMDDVDRAGAVEPIELADDLPTSAPKYDPFTGELVRPLQVKRDPNEQPHVDPATIPMAQRVVEYAGIEASPVHSMAGIAGQLINPVNVFVMLIILLAHVIFQPIVLMWAAGIYFVAPIMIMGMMFFLSHYGNVIDETGPGGQEELPRPLRDASLFEDIWRPFTHVSAALMLSYWPAFFAAKSGSTTVTIGFAILGTFIFPGLLLTLATSGSHLNLRPDRVLRVIAICGAPYLLSIGLFLAALLLYGVGMWRFQYDAANLFTSFPSTFAVAWWFEPWVAYPLLLGGILVMHWFCWSLGLMYRRHQPEFPWVLQRHIARRMNERLQRRSPAAGVPAPPAAARNPTVNSARVRQKMQSSLQSP